MTDREAYVKECMALFREFIGTCMEDHHADDRIALLVAIRAKVNDMLSELTED